MGEKMWVSGWRPIATAVQARRPMCHSRTCRRRASRSFFSASALRLFCSALAHRGRRGVVGVPGCELKETSLRADHEPWRTFG